MANKFLTGLTALLAAGAVWAALSAGPQGQYLAVWDNKVSSEAGTVRGLGPREYAYASPGGAAFAVVSIREGAMPPASTVCVYDHGGRLLWTAADVGATSAYVADSGAAALVTVRGEGPTAPARLDFYSAAGARTGGADVGPPLEAAFFPGEDKLALAVLGGATKVYDLAAGVEEYELPYARAAAAGPGGRVLLVDREWMALYRDGGRVWQAPHNLHYPRLAKISEDGTQAVVGAHHEVALVSLADGRVARRWKAPADFGVTDLAASADFSSFAVGTRSLQAREAAVWLDASLKIITQEKHDVAQPSGSSPTVAVLAGVPPRVLAMGQGWQATLTE